MDVTTLNLDNIPKVMKELPRWTVWSDGKVPYNAKFTDQRASSTEALSWSSLNQCLTRLSQESPFRPLYGLQYALTDGWIGIDLDDCILPDRSLMPWARDIVNRIDSYTEVSPSGNGLKIFLKADRKLFTHRAKQPGGGEIEVYTAGKLFTVTTNHMPGTPIAVETRNEEFSSVYDDYLYREGEDVPPPPPEEMEVSFEDQQIIERIRASKLGARFNELYSDGCGEGDSDDDWELAGMICFYTNDVEQVKRIMFTSGLVRDKWTKNKKYLDLTISKQMSGEKYTPAGSTEGQWMSMGTVKPAPGPAPMPPAASTPGVLPQIPPMSIPAAPASAIPPPAAPNPFASVRPEGEAEEIELINQMLDNPIDIQEYFDRAPRLVQQLTSLLTSLNDKMPAAMNFFTAMALINGASGKKLCTINKGTKLYAAYWNVVQALTGMGKSTMSSVQSVIRELLSERGNRAPFKFIPDKFTMSSLFSTYGEVTRMSEIERLDDVQLSNLEDQQIERGRAKMARMMMSDEFGHNLGIILRSGIEGGEKGNLLKLADSGTTITGDTTTKGQRVIHDVCTSIVAFTQPEVWQENFNPDEHLDSGLAGRFVMVSHEDYELTVNAAEMPFNDTLLAIKGVFRELLDRLDQIADRVQNDPDNPGDERGRIFDEVASEANIAAVAKHGFIDLSKLKGKLIGQALKLTAMHVFLDDQCNLRQLVGAPKVTAHDAVAPGAPPRHEYSMGDAREPGEDRELPPRLTYVDTKTLYNSEVYRSYIRLMTVVAVKAYNSKPGKGQRERLQEQAVRLLKRAKGQEQLASKLRNRGKWRLGGRELSSRDFISEVIQPAVECGLLKLTSEQGDPIKVTIGNTENTQI